MTIPALAIALYLPLFNPNPYELLAEEPTIEYDACPTQIETEVEPEPPSNEIIHVEATFYGADCYGCVGITATGDDVRDSIYVDGRRVIAVDPSVIALRSIVRVTLSSGESFEAIASDTGGRIKGRIIDVLVSSEAESYKYGRQTATVEILK